MSFLEDKNNKGNGQRTLKNVCSSTPPTLFKNLKKSLILLFKMRATIILDKNTENTGNIFFEFWHTVYVLCILEESGTTCDL